jgi:hypothetical protein
MTQRGVSPTLRQAELPKMEQPTAECFRGFPCWGHSNKRRGISLLQPVLANRPRRCPSFGTRSKGPLINLLS